MVRRRHGQRSIFEMLLPDGDKLWDPTLRRIDEVLQDEGMTDLVVEALGRRWRHSVGRGRPGTPAEVVLRMLVLKHLYDWSFEECEREVRGSLVYRAFCRIGCESVPDDKTLIRLASALGPDVLQRIVERLVRLARQRRVVRGLRLRVDTTVVETNIHYPTDSSLLADGVRVITRTVQKLGPVVGKKLRLRDRTRSVGRELGSWRMFDHRGESSIHCFRVRREIVAAEVPAQHHRGFPARDQHRITLAHSAAAV